MNIIALSMQMAEAVAGFVERARRFFYQAVLSMHECAGCGGSLEMISDGRCRCRSCGSQLDPTVDFQRCSLCGGEARLRVRRYECSQCGHEIASRFLFDGSVFDSEYFRQKMAEHRKRKAKRLERVRQLLAGSRSQGLEALPADLDAVPGLTRALDGLVNGTEPALSFVPRDGFDLRRYQAHVQAHIRPFPLALESIPPLGEHARIDRIRRFIAIIFLAHAGLLDVWQDGSSIMVMQRETDREGQEFSGDLEHADGFEGPLGRTET